MMQDGTPIYKRDHVPNSNSRIRRKSEKVYGAGGGDRTEEYIMRKLIYYGFKL